MLSSQGLRSSQQRSKAASKHIPNLPQRKHPIQVEIKEEIAVVAVPAKRSGLNRNQRAKVKSKPEDSEKVSSLLLHYAFYSPITSYL